MTSSESEDESVKVEISEVGENRLFDGWVKLSVVDG